MRTTIEDYIKHYEPCLDSDHHSRRKALIKLGAFLFKAGKDPEKAKTHFGAWVGQDPSRIAPSAKAINDWSHVAKGHEQARKAAAVQQHSVVLEKGDQAELGRHLEKVLTADSGGACPIYCEGLTYTYDQTRGYWMSHDDPQLMTRISDMGENLHCQGENGKIRPLHINWSTAQGAFKFFQARLAAESTAFLDQVGLSFRDGFVGIDGYLQPHSPKHQSRFYVDVDYDPTAQSKPFDEFLRSFFRTDVEDKVRFIKEYVGACLMGYGTFDERVMLLRGRGKNGKSSFTKVIKSLFPKEFVSELAPKRWDNRFDLAHLANKRINLAAELPSTDAIKSSDTFKNVTAGDSMTGEIKFGAFFGFTPICGHIFSANKLSDVSDDVAGFWRRFVVIELERDFLSPKEKADWVSKYYPQSSDQEIDDIIRLKNPNIVKDILSERYTIVNECVAAFLAAHKVNEYTIPESSERLIEEWRLDTVSHVRYINECWQYRPNAPRSQWVARTELYVAYKSWAKDNGNYPLSAQKFYKELSVNYSLDASSKRADGVRVMPFIPIDDAVPDYTTNKPAPPPNPEMTPDIAEAMGIAGLIDTFAKEQNDV